MTLMDKGLLLMMMMVVMMMMVTTARYFGFHYMLING